MVELAAGLIIFFAGGLAAFTALLAAFQKKNGTCHLFRILLYASLSLLLLEFYFTHFAGLIADMETHPGQTVFFLLIRLLKYSCGPLIYFYFAVLTEYKKITAAKILAHFIPQFIVWICAIVYFASSVLGWQSFAFLRTALWIVASAGFFHILVYMTATLVSYYHIEHSSDQKQARTLLIFSLAVTLFMGCVLCIYLLTGNHFIETAAPLAGSLALIVWFLMIQNNPNMLTKFSRSSKQKSYQRSLLAQADTELLISHLTELMEIEKIYCDEDLSLDRLASLMLISRHSLSELLNSKMHTRFADYINNYRVNEAKRMLREEPGRSIISVAYASGFNSKSVFYAVFSKHEQVTPQRFREQYHRANSTETLKLHKS